MSPGEIRLSPHVNQKGLVYFEIQLIQSSNGVLTDLLEMQRIVTSMSNGLQGVSNKSFRASGWNIEIFRGKNVMRNY